MIADNIIYKDKAMLGRADTGIAFLFLAKPASVQGLTSACSYKNKKQSGYIGKIQAEIHESAGNYLSGRHEEAYLQADWEKK